MFWFSHIVHFLLLVVTSPNSRFWLFFFFYIWLFRFYWFSSFIFFRPGFMTYRTISDVVFFFHFWSLELLNFRIYAFGICIVICIGFCLSHVNYVDVYICYAVGQLCFRISGFNLKKEAVSFRSLVDCIEYFYGSGGKNSCKCCWYHFCNTIVKNLNVAAEWKIWVLVHRC